MQELKLEDLFDDEPKAEAKPKFQLTSEQQAIVDAGLSSSTSLMITAMAGCSKTTVIEAWARTLPVRPSGLVVFNKKNKKEAEDRLRDPDSKLSYLGKPAFHFNCLTANGLGHGAWQRALGRSLILKERKIQDLTKEFLSTHRLDLTSEEYANLSSLVRMARVHGLVPQTFQDQGKKTLIEDTFDGWSSLVEFDLTDEFVFAARSILIHCIQQSYLGVIDFDDQIYMSSLFGGVFPRYQNLFVEEAQDLSALNHIQVAKSAADRLFIVGDPRQAIYAFRGAHSSSMDNLRKLREDWIDLPLSTTFRCPKAVVARQQSHVPGFSAHSSNQEGEVQDIRGSKWNINSLPKGPLTFLCRNNAPIISLALKIIKSGEGCTVLGSEIGKSLASLSKKIFPEDNLTIPECSQKIIEWSDHQSALARAQKKDAKAEMIGDKAECLLAVCENLPGTATSRDLRAALERIFSQGNLRIVLSSGHKAKGLEWPTVIHLDPWRIPSKWAKAAGGYQLEQEMNLKYVIETRSQHTLIFCNLEDFNEVL